jgi:hypothetical protein
MAMEDVATPPWWMPAKDRRLFRKHFRLTFNIHDVWLGVFWSVTPYTAEHTRTTGETGLVQVYVCVLPLFPIRISWSRKAWLLDLHIREYERAPAVAQKAS